MQVIGPDADADAGSDVASDADEVGLKGWNGV
jgi:hypothetical protein